MRVRILVLVALGVALVVQAALTFGAMADFSASDPLSYAARAYAIATGPAAAFAHTTTHPFDMRVGMTVPLALLYRVFGVSVAVSNLPSMLAGLAITAVVWAAAPTPRAKLIGLGITLASVPLIRHGALLLPDLPCAALLAVATLALARREDARGRWWLVVGMLAWFAAFLVKETALWLTPVWLYAMIVDARAGTLRDAARRHGPALALGVVLAAAYLVVCARVWGSPFARFQGIDALAAEHTWSLIGQPAHAWLARLTWEPVMLFEKLVGVALVPALLAGWLVRGPARIWVVATAVLAALFWWGSTSYSHYAPLPVRPRMALPVLPGLLVLAMLGTEALVVRVQARVRDVRVRWALAAAAVLVLVLPTIRPLRRALTPARPETAAYRVVMAAVATHAPIELVCADERGASVAPLYVGFVPPPNLTVRTAPEFAAGPPPAAAHVLVLANLNRVKEFRASDGDSEPVRAVEALALPMLYAQGGVTLYDAGDGARLWATLRACAGCAE